MSGTDLVYFAIAVVQMLIHTTGIAIFYRRRDLPPISYRYPTMSLVAASLTLLTSMWLCLERLVGACPIVLAFALSNLLTIGLIDSFIILVGRLLIAFNRSQEQMFISRRDLADEHEIRRRNRIVRWMTAAMRNDTAIAFLLISAIVHMAVLAPFVVRAPDLLYEKDEDADWTSGSPETSLNTAIFFQVAVECLIAGLLAYKVRLVQDVAGIKRSLLYTACSGIACGVLSALLGAVLTGDDANDAGNLLGILASNMTIFLFIEAPVLQTYKRKWAPTPLSSHLWKGQALQLMRFLSTPAGLDAFKEQLLKEFCVENVLFYEAVQDFKGIQGQAHIDQKGVLIYKRFVAVGAPCAINVSWETSSTLHKVFKESHHLVCNTDVFDTALLEIVKLMLMNSLARFIDSHQDMWDKFLLDSKEIVVLENVARTVNGGTTTTSHVPLFVKPSASSGSVTH